MKVGLFLPCYIDQLYPQVGMATLNLLESLGCEVDYPEAQSCCGQPMANTGCWDQAKPLAKRFVEIFEPYDAIVCPSGSCVSMVVHHYKDLLGEDPAYKTVQEKTFELCQFLETQMAEQMASHQWPEFPYQVGLHQSCHGLRELRLGSSSELNQEQYSTTKSCLERCTGITFSELKRKDECCGFGGTFAVSEEAVSCMMGNDRIHDHLEAGTEVLTAGDMSCLMHMEGLIKRQNKPLKVMHVAEILVGQE